MHTSAKSGRSAARLAHQHGGLGVGGSNPLAPTSFFSMKRTALLFVVFALFTASCQRHGPSGVPFWHAMGGPLGDVLDSIITLYNQEHSPPIISVKMGNYATLSQKIMGAVASNKPPVMAQVYESWAAELLENNKLVPIQEFLPFFEDSVLEDIWPPLIEDNLFDSTLVSFPFNKSVPVFYYNQDLFEEFGIDSFPKTWEEFREVCKKLTVDRDGDGTIDLYGTAFPVSVWWFLTMLYQKGGSVIRVDSIYLDTPEAQEVLQYLVDLIYKDSCAYLTTGFRHQDDFATGRVAMVWGTIVSYSFMKQKIRFRLGVAPVPNFGEPKVVVSGTNVALFKGATPEELQTAVSFLRFFLKPEIQAMWSTGTGYIPLRRSVLNHPKMQAFLQQVPGMKEAILQLEHATFEPRDPVWFTGRRYLATEGLEPALRGVLSVEASLKRAQKFLETELKRRRRMERALAERKGAH